MPVECDRQWGHFINLPKVRRRTSLTVTFKGELAGSPGVFKEVSIRIRPSKRVMRMTNKLPEKVRSDVRYSYMKGRALHAAATVFGLRKRDFILSYGREVGYDFPVPPCEMCVETCQEKYWSSANPPDDKGRRLCYSCADHVDDIGSECQPDDSGLFG